VALVARRRWIPTWFAGFLVGFGPFAGYLLTRLVGLPGDPGDFANWSDPLGTASLFVEGTLMLVTASVLVRFRRTDRFGSTAAAGPADAEGFVALNA
jgi:hypothetical protein